MTTAATRKTAARVSRLRVLAMAERERYRHGWSVLGDRIEQRCPCCYSAVRAAAPDPPTNPADMDAYTHKISNLLNDAVLEHIDHDCPDPREEAR
jgi:hypothetical protein